MSLESIYLTWGCLPGQSCLKKWKIQLVLVAGNHHEQGFLTADWPATSYCKSPDPGVEFECVY